jgi:chromosome segregation ATPase
MPPIPDVQFSMPGFPHDFSFHMRPNFHLDSLDAFKFHFNDHDFEGFNDEMEALMKEKFEALGPQFEESMKQMEEQLQHMDMSLNRQLDGLNENLDNQLKHLEHNLGNLNLDLSGLDENLKHLDENLKHMNESIKAFEKDAQEELIKDGYLKEGERIESMEWMDHNIKFNGIKIKPEHQEKYRELKEKHIKHQWQRGRPE